MKPPRWASIRAASAFTCALAWAAPALAGPPFLSDDPDTTPYRHYEILAFASGVGAHGSVDGDSGIDFNYGGGPNLQLTATVPISFEDPSHGPSNSGLGTIELAAKYRFLHQEGGWSAAIFPRVFVPAGPGSGDGHLSLLIPVWAGRSGEGWSVFGGGGCAFNHGGEAQDYCLTGLGATHDFGDKLHLGAEVFRQGADTRGGYASTTLGLGGTFDINDNLHLLAWLGRGVENPEQTGRGAAYASVLFTF